jgi:hypothetical protein
LKRKQNGRKLSCCSQFATGGEKIKKQQGEVERKDRKTERRIRGTAWGIFRMIGERARRRIKNSHGQKLTIL